MASDCGQVAVKEISATGPGAAGNNQERMPGWKSINCGSIRIV